MLIIKSKIHYGVYRTQRESRSGRKNKCIFFPYTDTPQSLWFFRLKHSGPLPSTPSQFSHVSSQVLFHREFEWQNDQALFVYNQKLHPDRFLYIHPAPQEATGVNPWCGVHEMKQEYRLNAGEI